MWGWVGFFPYYLLGSSLPPPHTSHITHIPLSLYDENL